MRGIEVTQRAPVSWVVSRPRELIADDAALIAAVHASLRHLVLACRAARRPLPMAPAVIADSGVVEMYLAAPLGMAPAPWRARGHVWRVEVARLGAVRVALDAYPGLVPLGHLRRESVQAGSSRWLLADLGAAPGLVEIDGEPGAVDALQRSIARSLLEHPWSGGVHVALLDLPAPDHPRVRSVAGLDAALGVPPVPPGGVTGRWGGPPRGRHEVVLVGRPLTADEARLVRRTARRRGAPTVVAPGHGRGVWQWHVDAEGLTW